MTRSPVAAVFGVCFAAFAVLAVMAVSAALGACGASDDAGPAEPQARPRPDPVSSVPDAARVDLDVPAVDGPYWPAMAQVRGEVDVALLADVEFCARCHEDMFDQWRVSAHARSSFDNPWYRATVDALRHDGGDAGPTESRFCAGCHDPLLLLSGRMDLPEIAPDDPLAHAGVTCMVCHGIVEASTDGNASWVLDTSPVPVPVRGDEASIEAHRERMAIAPLDEASLCGSCHRAFLTEDSGNAHFLPGTDDLGPWRASAFGDTDSARIDDDLEDQTCQGCHMPGEPASGRDRAAAEGELSSHRFAGGQTALARQTTDPRQLAAVEAMLEGAATIDVASLRFGDGRIALPADGAEVTAGADIALDVVVRNARAGHRFPGGVRDTQDTWVEVEVRAANGRVIAEAGTAHRTTEDPTAHRLNTVMLDGEGRPELRHFVQRFEGKGWDHTIAPRDAAITRYTWVVPEGLPASAFPLGITARLVHRRHGRPMHDVACEAMGTPRGRAFSAAARSLGNAVIDACAPQPVTEVAEARVWVGAGSEGRAGTGGAARPAWRRLYEHALGLAHQVQERTDEARPSVEGALRLLADSSVEGNQRPRAMVLVALARIEGRQGRVEQALAAADDAEALVGRHPAIDRARGDALAQVWRWADAAEAYGRLVELAPGDSAAWRAYARALGSTQDDEAALAATARGLALAPRDEAMLRTRALALAAQNHDEADRARDLFLTHRRPDEESALRLTCAQEVDGCARDQLPVVTIALREQPLSASAQ